jgi:hypothetical protein
VWAVNLALAHPWNTPDFWHIEPESTNERKKNVKYLEHFFSYRNDTVVLCEQECWQLEKQFPKTVRQIKQDLIIKESLYNVIKNAHLEMVLRGSIVRAKSMLTAALLLTGSWN